MTRHPFAIVSDRPPPLTQTELSPGVVASTRLQVVPLRSTSAPPTVRAVPRRSAPPSPPRRSRPPPPHASRLTTPVRPSLAPRATQWVGRYRIVRRLGSGGMADVYLGAVDSIGGFERLFAVKVVKSRLLKDEKFVSMLLDEARIAGRVNHANVVSVHDVHHSGNQLYLVMDYVEGTTLAELTNSLRDGGGSVPIEIAIRVALDLLSALEAIHELRDHDGKLLNVIHRDVSPHNVLVGVDGVCRLTDFGIARARGRLTETPEGVLKGTLGYVAPESITGRAVDHRADLYSLGVLFWELLVGQKLFSRANLRSDPRLSKPARPPTDPRDVNRRIPDAVAAVCMRALEPEATNRYANAQDMAAALEEAMVEAGIQDVGSRLTGRLVSALRRIKAHGAQPGARAAVR